MKNTQHTFTVIIEKDTDGYYVATVPALKFVILKPKLWKN